jgi:hypothetical protein
MAGDVDAIYLPTTNIFDFVDKDTWLNQHKIVSTKPGIVVEAHPSLDVAGMQMNLDWTTTYQVPKHFPGILMPFILPAISIFGVPRFRRDE